MKRRKRRHFVGTLPATLPEREFSVDRTVEEGLLIALSAIRMAIKNLVILGVLRERADFDPTKYVEATRGQIQTLAAQNTEFGEHFRTGALAAGELDEEDAAKESRRLDRLSLVHNRISDELTAVANDEERVLAIIEQARDSAWNEIGDAWMDRLTRDLVEVLPDPDYARHREGRLQEFIYIDLAGLLVEEGAGF